MISETAPGNGSTPSMDERIAALLSRKPSGPHFIQSSITYADECIQLGMAKLGHVLVNQYPDAAEPIIHKLRDVAFTHYPLSANSLVEENGRKRLLFLSNGKSILLNRLAESACTANPNLGTQEYIMATYATKDPRRIASRFPWFNTRLAKVMEIGMLPLEDPRISYLATGYLTQIGKIFAVRRSRNLLTQTQFFGGTESLEAAFTYLDRVGKQVGVIRTDQDYILTGFSTLNAIADQAGMKPTHTLLLLDLAFIRSRSLEDPVEFAKVLDPLIRLVAAQKWDEAFIHRDFLLKYFCGAFPEWRAREFIEREGVAYASFDELAKAVVNQQLSLEVEEIPSRYRAAFAEIFPSKVEIAKKDKEREIMIATLGLSNQIIAEVGIKVEGVLRKKNVSRICFYADGPRGQALLSLEEEQRRREFFYLVRRGHPKKTHQEVSDLYEELLQNLTPVPDNSLRYKTVFIPEKRQVLDISIDKSGQQVCWYLSSFYYSAAQDHRGPIGRTKISFGKLLGELISNSNDHEPHIEKYLDIDSIKEAVFKAYDKARIKNPALKEISLEMYFNTLADYLENQGDKKNAGELRNFVLELTRNDHN